MSETAPENTPNPESKPGDEFAPITSQEDFEKRLGKRLERERAKFSDYEELKADALEFRALNEASRPEIDKVNGQLAKETERAVKAEAALMRHQVAGKHGITDPDDIDLFLTGTDEETLTKQAERLAARTEAKPSTPRSPREGGNPTPKSDNLTQFARGLFGD